MVCGSHAATSSSPTTPEHTDMLLVPWHGKHTVPASLLVPIHKTMGHGSRPAHVLNRAVSGISPCCCSLLSASRAHTANACACAQDTHRHGQQGGMCVCARAHGLATPPCRLLMLMPWPAARQVQARLGHCEGPAAGRSEAGRGAAPPEGLRRSRQQRRLGCQVGSVHACMHGRHARAVGW